MRRLNQVYTQGFNRRHDRFGHILQGRYKRFLVEKQGYLLELTRYVALNPVRADVSASRISRIQMEIERGLPSEGIAYILGWYKVKH